MKRLVRVVAPSVVALLGALSLVLVSQSGAVAAAATSGVAPVAPGLPAPATWGTLQRQAFDAVGAFRGAGPLRSPVEVSPVESGTVMTASGAVPVVQRTIVTSDASGRLVLVLALLGGTQLVVDEMSPTAGGAGATLVLSPGTSHIDGIYPIGGRAASAAAHRGRGIVAETAVLHRSVHPASGASGGAARARLVTSTYGCAGTPQYPDVIGSIYGPLIQGEVIVECGAVVTISIIGALYEWGTSISTAWGSSYTWYYAFNVYHACSLITGTNAFRTAELYSINGVLQPGTSSGWSWLNCA